MSGSNISFVRNAMLQPEPAPASQRGAIAWIRRNLLATPKDIVLTVIAIAALAWVLPHMINWLFIQAVWTGTDRTFCATTVQGGTQPDGWSGACWAFVNAKLDQFVYGRYTLDERWRPTLVFIMFAALLTPMLIPSMPR